MALYLGFDVGTQGTKALLIDDAQRAVVARASASYGLIEGLPAGHAEQHPDTWAAALREVTTRILEQADLKRLAGIGVSGQQHGAVVLDGRGEVVRPAKLWCDTSAAEEAEELSARVGCTIPAGFTAPKLTWMRRHEPELWRKVDLVLLPHDWVNWKLTGLATMEPGDASGTGWFDPRARAFSARTLRIVDPALAGMLPPLVESGSIAGTLTAEGAAWLGLPRECVGVPVSTGGGDNMMSAIGAGATREGVAVLSLGTSATVFAHSSSPIVDPEGLIAPFCDSTGGWLPLLCVMNATGVLEEVRAAFGADLETLTREAERVEPLCGGLLFVPYLVGERVPNLPRASGSLLGVRPGLLRPGVVFRAALEGVALNLALGVERMRGLGLTVDTVRAVGGGARNALWRSILADALEATVVPLSEPETAALGAALQAAWTRRRSDGEGLGMDAVASGWATPAAPPVRPNAQRVLAMRAARERLARSAGA
jgi:D-xylulose kinase